MPIVAYDLTKKKIGCVIIQAALGGDSSIVSRIPCEHWSLELSETMKPYRMTEDQVEDMVAFHAGIPKDK